MPVVDFQLKIGMFPRMKTDNVALQLSKKRMTRMAGGNEIFRFWWISHNVVSFSPIILR
jgi:hypothetical protein